MTHDPTLRDIGIGSGVGSLFGGLISIIEQRWLRITHG